MTFLIYDDYNNKTTIKMTCLWGCCQLCTAKTCSYFWPKICITNHSALELAFFMRSKPAHWGKVSCDKHHWPSPHICGLIYTTSPYPSSSVRLIYTTISRGCTSWDTISFGRKKTAQAFTDDSVVNWCGWLQISPTTLMDKSILII